MAPTKRNIVFFHPDLGIGGAERLVIDAAVGLQNLGHKVVIFTSHCDPTHCFDEARNGTLDVRVRGNTIVPPSILGRFSILCAILRQLHLIVQVSLLSTELGDLKPTIFFVDQLSAGVPLLRYMSPSARILFYCHFPDKLLAQRGSVVKKLYRLPFDWVESWSTGCADTIVVNSNFTRSVFAQAFPALQSRTPKVVYPCVDTSLKETQEKEGEVFDTPPWEGKRIILSINRFERKKAIELALKAYAGLTEEERENTRLVLAGGYDMRVAENVSYHQELTSLASDLGLKAATAKAVPTALAIPSDVAVLFLLSVPSTFKTTLLAASSLLVYTPRHEHFGIVPLEAMLAGVPVLAANEGGPTETVEDNVTGWLRNVGYIPAWTDVMRKVLCEMDDETRREMGNAGRSRVVKEFSDRKMAARLQEVSDEMVKAERQSVDLMPVLLLLFGVFGAAVSLALAMAVLVL